MRVILCIFLFSTLALPACKKHCADGMVCNVTASYIGMYIGEKRYTDFENQVDTTYIDTLYVTDFSNENSCRIAFSTVVAWAYVRPAGQFDIPVNGYTSYIKSDSLIIERCISTMSSCVPADYFKGKKQ